MTGQDPELELFAERTALVLVDWQDKLVAAMPPEAAQACVRNAVILTETARRLGLPVFVSEQYPKGLGRTVTPLEQALAELPRLVRFEKLDFACAGLEGFDREVAKSGRTHFVVAGMEAHVCVYQTARALARSWRVFVPDDATLSRSKANWRVGLRLCERAGCVISSTETIVFDLLKRAGTADFKALSQLLK